MKTKFKTTSSPSCPSNDFYLMTILHENSIKHQFFPVLKLSTVVNSGLPRSAVQFNIDGKVRYLYPSFRDETVSMVCPCRH